MDRHQKRTLTFVTIGLIFVLSGIEYGKFVTAPLMVSLDSDLPGVPAASCRLGKQAPRSRPRLVPLAVILPTIWRYLQILEAPPYFLGLGLSAFSLSGLLAGPLFGFWSDRSGRTKSIVLFSNLFEIGGELPGQEVAFDLDSVPTVWPSCDHHVTAGGDPPNGGIRRDLLLMFWVLMGQSSTSVKKHLILAPFFPLLSLVRSATRYLAVQLLFGLRHGRLCC